MNDWRSPLRTGLAMVAVGALAFTAGQLTSAPAAGKLSTRADDRARMAARAAQQADYTASIAPHSTGEGAASRRSEEALELAQLAEPLRWTNDPVALIASVIDGMSRDELALAVATVTGRDRSELEARRDLHRFATSLAGAALSGVVTDPLVADAQSIDFATRLRQSQDAEGASEVFPASARRMFGVFPLDEGARDQVIAKWYRVDEPELLMFRELPIREQNGQGFVRFDRREGWPEGEYRLEIYAFGDDRSSSDELELIASGDYRTEGRGPRSVLFQ